MEIRKSVVEGFLIQLYDVGVSSFMVAMAIGASVFASASKQAMEAGRLLDIERNLFVAIQAKGCLIVAVECRVAGGALRLNVCMAFDYFSRHHQSFNACGIAWLCTKNC